jgi:heat shock protein HslJ
MKPSLTLLIIFSIISNTSLGQTETSKTIIVADAKISCNYQNTIMACLKIKSHPDSIWRDFPYEIEGFIFEPGFETTIEISESVIQFPGDSAAIKQYKLVKTISKVNKVLTDKRLLSNNRWKIVNYEKDGTHTPLRRTNAFAIFDIDNNKISGNNSCNTFNGNTIIEDGVISFGILMSTKMACENNQSEALINEALTGKAAYYVRNNILFIICENRGILHLKPEKRLDSMMQVINTPKSLFDGNTMFALKDGKTQVKLDGLPQAKNRMMVFNTAKLTEAEKKPNSPVAKVLVNIDSESEISKIQILKTPHKINNSKYIIVFLKDGTKQKMEISEVY